MATTFSRFARRVRPAAAAAGVAVAQLVSGSFRRTMAVAMAIGVLAAVVGLSITWFHDAAPGATIVLLTIAAYALVAMVRPWVRGRSGEHRDPHPDLPDDVQLPIGG